MVPFASKEIVSTRVARRRRRQYSYSLPTRSVMLLTISSLVLFAPPALAQTTERVSVNSSGTEATGRGLQDQISADGRWVTFISNASNLISGDTNNVDDVFIHDRQTGITERVSIATDGSEANSGSYSPSINADGRFVAFASSATNLVSGDANGKSDVFVHDDQTGVTERVSVASGGAEGNSDSSTGFGSWISADGRWVTFVSNASNLVPADTNNTYDVFVHDRQTGTTTRVSVATDGAQANSDVYGPSISADGRFVAFHSGASNLVSGDANETYDVFIHDRQTGVTERVSVATDGSEANGDSLPQSISADGRFVAFSSDSNNLVSGDTNNTYDVFVRDRQAGVTERVSIATGGAQTNFRSGSYDPSISADGRFVAFLSYANNLVSGDTNDTHDAFIRDRGSAITERVSVATDGAQANTGGYTLSSISADGRFVAFPSEANNLVSGDSNHSWDIFVRDRGPQSGYLFNGFDSPLENLPFTNSAKAGSAIPIKWQVNDQNGSYVSDLGLVRSMQFAPVACDAQDLDYENPIDALAVGGSGLHYDALTNEFSFAWKTEKSMAKTCDVFILTLAGGQQHFARFMLK